MTGCRAYWALLILVLSATACGQRPERDRSLANVVADKFLDDAAKIPPAANAKLAKELRALVTCSDDRIRKSDIAYGDSDASINAKVQAAMQYCSDQVYGPTKPQR